MQPIRKIKGKWYNKHTIYNLQFSRSTYFSLSRLIYKPITFLELFLISRDISPLKSVRCIGEMGELSCKSYLKKVYSWDLNVKIV